METTQNQTKINSLKLREYYLQKLDESILILPKYVVNKWILENTSYNSPNSIGFQKLSKWAAIEIGQLTRIMIKKKWLIKETNGSYQVNKTEQMAQWIRINTFNIRERIYDSENSNQIKTQTLPNRESKEKKLVISDKLIMIKTKSQQFDIRINDYVDLHAIRKQLNEIQDPDKATKSEIKKRREELCRISQKRFNSDRKKRFDQLEQQYGQNQQDYYNFLQKSKTYLFDCKETKNLINFVYYKYEQTNDNLILYNLKHGKVNYGIEIKVNKMLKEFDLDKAQKMKNIDLKWRADNKILKQYIYNQMLSNQTKLVKWVNNNPKITNERTKTYIRGKINHYQMKIDSDLIRILTRFNESQMEKPFRLHG